MTPSRPILSVLLLAGLSFAETALAEDAPKPKGEACASGEPPRHRVRVPIVDAGIAADGQCLEHPDEDDVLAELDRLNEVGGRRTGVERRNVRFQAEKIGDKVDPCKVYPLAGPCQLVHCHYKCVVSFDERSASDYPVPFESTVHREEVVYIEKDYLRRCKPSNSEETSPPKTDTEQRLSAIEQKLDRVLRELESLKAERRGPKVSGSEFDEP